MKNLIKLSLLVGVFALFISSKPATAALEDASCNVSTATATAQTISFENESPADDHFCHRRCEHHYNRCVASCPTHHHHGRICRERCEREYRTCRHHCGHH